MAVKSLAIKYRPRTWEDVTDQTAVKSILTQQLDSGTIKNAYLFCGGAGTGKTTSARILANQINKGHGNPIEMDAASNNSVEDVRDIISQAKTKSLDSEYKVFILDECHSLSNQAWQAFLKVLEEPPAKSIFIFCTTDPQKIPKTILSRVQRYDFQRISQQGIEARLVKILNEEHKESGDSELVFDNSAIEYIAKIADGGMRDAITMLDKCLAYSTELTEKNVIAALGITDYDSMIKLTEALIDNNSSSAIEVIENIHMSGKDLKQFIKSYLLFLLDVAKYDCTRDFKYSQLPSSCESVISKYTEGDFVTVLKLLDVVVKLNSEIKWETSPKAIVESTLILFVSGM